MKLPDLRSFDLTGKRVLVRVDFDVPLRLANAHSLQQSSGQAGQALQVADNTRIENSLPTINLFLSEKARIILLSHLGRPEGKFVPELSLRPVAESLATILQRRNIVRREDGWQIGGEDIFLRENLRFEPGEEDPSTSSGQVFVKELASLGEFYVNEAFAVCHREHASIIGLPQQFKSKNSVAAGLSLLREVEVLLGILEKPKRPLVVILGGAKEDKLAAMTGLLKFADQILVGGKLPLLISNFKFQISNLSQVVVGELNESQKDITLETVENFSRIIQTAGTIVWSGPMGQYEDEGGKWEVGTRRIAEAVVHSGAFTVIGGGDTEAALTKFGLVQKINFVSSGGGAMLEFLANGDLPGLKALRE